MALTEKKLQIYLPQSQYRGIKAAAKSKHTSAAHVVREAVALYLAQDKSRWESERMSRHFGMFKGPKDLAANHDHYIYDYEP